METACLRIRFTPLLQNIQKEDSKHCLEIVPEISCIQNLDRIQWKKGENSIEYTIPMTYKIILKKKRVIEDKFSVSDLVKTYHSCVDLLLPSADTEDVINQGSGDISRIVSDSFVLSKITADVEQCNVLLNKNSLSDSIELTTTQVQTDLRDPSFNNQLVANEMIIANNNRQDNATSQTDSQVVQRESVIQVSRANIYNYIKSSIDKLTNTELPSTTNGHGVKISTWETLLTINSRTEAQQKLSITPICSINTDDEAVPVEVGTSNTLVFRVHESQNAFACGKIHDRNDKNFALYHEKNNHDYNRNIDEYDCVKNCRIQPEVRVANFIRIMEKEIMPLKLMLSDILNKCSSLGFTRRKAEQTPFIYKTVQYSGEPMNRWFKTKRQAKSNRVVYSIVFDGY